ncbi:glycosyl transferase family 2 [Terribacillus saccharophilus]|nr:glycosyl transferase family 2 [Terribacillus saccharophilus]
MENMGFVKTVNKGIKHTKHDIIILNSDTVVTDYWIDKLKVAAYSNSKVGSVTTLTNNGTIASVPMFNKDNNLPKGYSIEEFSILIDKVSKKLYPVIPTAVGHAMFIKRAVINKIGLFDEVNFGKGYGEEEDYSARLIEKGYINILADDTFIYHHGSTSFKSDKKELIRKNKRILKKKHKLHAFRVKHFLLFDRKVKRICKNIQRCI